MGLQLRTEPQAAICCNLWSLLARAGFALSVSAVSILPLGVSFPSAAQTPFDVDETTVSLQSCSVLASQPDPVQTQNTICEEGLTPPSLWWMREQLSSQLRNRKLIDSWRAEPRPGDAAAPRVVLFVNSQAWSLLDYFERYEFLNAFGLASQDFGYELEVWDNRGIQMAAYGCEGDRCRITMGSDRSGFRSQRRSPF